MAEKPPIWSWYQDIKILWFCVCVNCQLFTKNFVKWIWYFTTFQYFISHLTDFKIWCKQFHEKYYVFKIIIFRTGEIEEEAIAHEGNKAARAIFLKNGLVFTTGFTKHSERQYSLRAPGHLDDPIVMVELDTSNGVMFPLYDPDANLIYLCGKVGCSTSTYIVRNWKEWWIFTKKLDCWRLHNTDQKDK